MRKSKLPNLVEIAHLILASLSDIEVAVDMTSGNGHDTAFLAEHFPVVYGFDIQASAIENTREKVKDAKVTLIHDDHYNFDAYVTEVDLFVFNLGWLPGSDKEIVTSATTTLKTLKKCKKHLKEGGVICITCYNGDSSQQEETKAVQSWLTATDDLFVQKFSLPKAKNSPILYIMSLKPKK